MDDRPSVRPAESARRLTDAAAPDFLESHAVAVLAFVDLSQEASERLAGAIERVALAFEHRAAFGWLDVRSDPLVAHAIDVKRVPQVVVFLRGRETDRLLGVPPDDVLSATVRARLAAG